MRGVFCVRVLVGASMLVCASVRISNAAECRWIVSPSFYTIEVGERLKLRVDASNARGDYPMPKTVVSAGANIGPDGVFNAQTPGSKIVRVLGRPCEDGFAAILVSAPPLDQENERYIAGLSTVGSTLTGTQQVAVSAMRGVDIFREYTAFNFVHMYTGLRYEQRRFSRRSGIAESWEWVNGVRLDQRRSYAAISVLHSGSGGNGTAVGLGIQRLPELFYKKQPQFFGSVFYYPAAANVLPSADTRRFYYLRYNVGVAIMPAPYGQNFLMLQLVGSNAMYRGSPPMDFSDPRIALSLGHRI